jgi:hypothetical protein
MDGTMMEQKRGRSKGKGEKSPPKKFSFRAKNKISYENRKDYLTTSPVWLLMGWVFPVAASMNSWRMAA